jgi:hypothetical protein
MCFDFGTLGASQLGVERWRCGFGANRIATTLAASCELTRDPPDVLGDGKILGIARVAMPLTDSAVS